MDYTRTDKEAVFFDKSFPDDFVFILLLDQFFMNIFLFVLKTSSFCLTRFKQTDAFILSLASCSSVWITVGNINPNSVTDAARH